MRTAIYVYSETATFTLDQEIVPCPGMGNVVNQDGPLVTLAKGIYKTASSELQPTAASDHDVVVIANDKDPWPEPPPRFWKAFTTMTLQRLDEFFPSSFGQHTQAPDATVACDDEDWPEIQDALSKAGFTATRAA